MRVAIFGGTFNPVHWGHLLIAETAASQFHLDRVLWVPTYQPPHKRQKLTAFEHRLVMVKRAIADNPRFLATDVERQRGGLSYAIETFQDLQALYGQCQWFWILGQDAFQHLPQWRGAAELAATCVWLVAPRPSAVPQSNPQSSPQSSPQINLPDLLDRSWLNYHLLEMPSIDLSSSLVRRYCEQGRSIRYLIPEAVRHYLQEQQLFQPSGDEAL